MTGGLGFVGSNLALRLVELGAEVLIVDSMLPAYGGTPKNVEPAADRLRIDLSDVRDTERMRTLVQDCDLIFSLAGQISHSESMRDPMTDLQINCSSQLSLLECCRHENPRAKIVFASTRQLYGRPQYLPVDEAHPLIPVDVNGINKLAAERYYTLYHEVYGMRTVSLRLTNTYGPRMEITNDKKGFVGVFLRKALIGEKIQIFGTGEQRRDFNYVSDVVEALLLAGQDDGVNGEVYNLGHPEPASLLEFVDLMSASLDFDTELVPFPAAAKQIDIGDYYGDFSRYHDATGWQPRVGLESGLEQSIRWYQEQGWSAGS